ncbi:DUF3429 domain-containing protein [Cocleimonas sp. KMM 6892]|nr:DUF3429 domain-containing protein [Cocleimonas sp. KMM 6892]
MTNTSKTMYLLGYAGVIPFLLLAVLVARDQPSFFYSTIPLAVWLGIYAAVILSFLGAVSWGVALANQAQLNTKQTNQLLYYGVVPSLLAWLSLLLPINLALAVMAGLIVLAYLVDLLLLAPCLPATISSQYIRLRFHLSITVATLLLLSSIFAR